MRIVLKIFWAYLFVSNILGAIIKGYEGRYSLMLLYILASIGSIVMFLNTKKQL